MADSNMTAPDAPYSAGKPIGAFFDLLRIISIIQRETVIYIKNNYNLQAALNAVINRFVSGVFLLILCLLYEFVVVFATFSCIPACSLQVLH